MVVSKCAMSTFEIPVFQNQYFSKIQHSQKWWSSGVIECSFTRPTHLCKLSKNSLKSENVDFGHTTFWNYHDEFKINIQIRWSILAISIIYSKLQTLLLSYTGSLAQLCNPSDDRIPLLEKYTSCPIVICMLYIAILTPLGSTNLSVL